MATRAAPNHVVVVGGGFGGLEAVKALRGADVDITLLDRHNYHLFQPLTYQIATGGLAPGEVAMPLRHIFRGEDRIRVLMGEVTGFDLERRYVVFRAIPERDTLAMPYDYLVVAGGSTYSYFGHEDWRTVALEVKSLDSALEVRGRIFQAFEAAELHPEEQESWLTFVIVGAGPTGVEMAGQIAELARDTLRDEFRQIDPRAGRVLLVEMGDRVLAGFHPSLSRRAARSLQGLGVTPLLGHTVVEVEPDGVEIEDAKGGRSRIPTRTVVWAAGVTASGLARSLANASVAEADRAGRLTVQPDLTLPGHSEVLALGDMVRVRDPHTWEPREFPGVAQVAIQQGCYAGRLIAARVAGTPAPPPFHYRDKGMLATIGRAQAVADLGWVRFGGFPAWFVWVAVHIFYLIGFENRALVMFRWAYSYFTRGRGSRLITEAVESPPQAPGG